MIDFHGRVAAVTGAGRGIGREYARLLAERGAAVVVNDIGADVTGEGHDLSVAQTVVDEIAAAGGRATASTDDISTPEGGARVIERAVGEFGRIDVLVHNAGSMHRAPFVTFPLDAARKILATHLLGAFHVGQPAWREMAARGYGRILFTTSVAIFGAPDLSAYSAAKMGCIGLANTLAAEAERDNLDIKVNTISPTAATRRAQHAHRNDAGAGALDARFGEWMHPRFVAAVALPLLAEECPVNGTCIKAGGSVASRIFVGLTRGWSTGGAPMSPEAVAEHLADALDLDGYSVPRSSAHARELTLEQAVAAATDSEP